MANGRDESHIRSIADGCLQDGCMQAEHVHEGCAHTRVI
jgi:hypothetical protein